MTCRGSGRGRVEQARRTELCKKKHLPQASDALIKQGMPEHEAVRQIDELLLEFGLKTICQKLNAFMYRNQWKKP